MQEYVQLSVLLLMTLNNLALVTGGEIASTFGNPESVKFWHRKLIEEIMIGRGWQILREHPIKPHWQKPYMLCMLTIKPRSFLLSIYLFFISSSLFLK